MSDLGIFEHYPDCDMQYAPLDACRCSTRRIRDLEEVLQDVVDETAHLACYSQATTNKILAALQTGDRE